MRRTDSGFVVDPLPPPAANAWSGCRLPASWQNPPRHLAELRSSDSDTEVIDLEPSITSTDAYVCARDGSLLSHLVLDGDWSLGETTRLVDVDRDFQPDLVRVGFGFYQIRPNQSTPAGFDFGPPVSGTLSPAFTPTSVWVQDFNGDGLPDLVARDSATFTVWFGEGNFQFAPTGQTFDLRDPTGVSVANLDDYTYRFVDANRDGLTDLLLVQNSDFYLFVNNGYYLQQVPIPALSGLAVDATSPLFADLSGAGNDALTVVVGAQALSLALDEPGTGLLSSADDGKGTVLSFDWQRAPAVAGEFHRQVVLAQLTVTSTGDGSAAYQYAYGAPRIHSVGRFLVGFQQVTRTAPTAADATTFLQDDDVAGVVSTSTHADQLTPDVMTFEAHDYDEQRFAGLRWLRPKSLRRGDQSLNGSVTLEHRTDWVAWDADFCAAKVTTTDARGTLTVEDTRADVSALANNLHCLIAAEVQTGVHADARLNFRHEEHAERNAVGLVWHTTKVGALGTLTMQTISYNPDWTVASVSSPATGTSTFAWDAKSHLLKEVDAFDGTRTWVATRDPVTDAVGELDTAHGALVAAGYFRYDGQERLYKRWDNLGQATEANPAEQLAYRYATATQPAAIGVRMLVDASAGAVAQSVELSTAAGEALTTVSRIPEGWSVAAITTRDPSRAEIGEVLRPTLPPTADPSTIDVATLMQGAQPIALRHASTLAVDADTLMRFSSTVQRTTKTQLGLSAAARAETEVENGVRARVRDLDVGGRMTAYQDPSGATWLYQYDVLGRLRAVTLPDGSTHRRDVDDYGRDSVIARDGVGRVEYAYDAARGLIAHVRFVGRDGTPMRAVSYSYDGVGRKTNEQHVDLTSGATQDYTWYYDGATPASPTAAGAAGLLTGVAGDGYTRTFDYRADGRLAHRRTTLAGWRIVDTTFNYAESGLARGHTTTVRAADGTALSTSDVEDRYDAFGRVGTILLDGQSLATLGYDGNGLIASATFPTGKATFGYEPLTRAPDAFAQTTAAWVSDNRWQKNDRGLTDSELVSVGGVSVTRQYRWSPSGYLKSSVDALASWQYDYDGAGLPSRIVDADGDRALHGTADGLDAGGVAYRLDGLGRTVQRGDLALSYAPNGQLGQAQRGSSTWGFKYDEAGQRILKLSGGEPLAAMLPEGYLDASGLTEPVRVGEHAVGAIVAGRFRQLPTDHRGTVFAEDDGTARLASPFGDRATHPALAAAIDYVQKGWDADLGVVRMGVRDYDPRIDRFWTPDPLFMAHPDRCVGSPVECNLYGYAGNAPTDFVDPTGTDIKFNSPEDAAAFKSWSDQRRAEDNKQLVICAVVAFGGPIGAAVLVTQLTQNHASAPENEGQIKSARREVSTLEIVGASMDATGSSPLPVAIGSRSFFASFPVIGAALREAMERWTNPLSRSKWKLGANDLNWVGQNRTFAEALAEAFRRTGVSREAFEVTRWGKDANGKSFPVEYRAPGGAEVSVDIGHMKNGPQGPHVGYQGPGKGATSGHILIDDVPVNR